MPIREAERIGKRDDEADGTGDLLDIPLTQPLNDPQPTEPILFEKLVLVITNANRVKRRLNKDKQSRRDDPKREGSVSSDEEEDTVPDHLAFDAMAETLCSESMRTPGMSNHPSVDLLGMHIGTQPDA